MKHNVSVSGRRVGKSEPCLVVAEVGVNHNGDPELAKQMIEEVARAGAECVKFQTFSADEFVNSAEDIYEYYSQGRKVQESMLTMFRRLELKRKEFESLFDHARRHGLIPLSTPTDTDAVDLLEGLGSAAYKVGSDDLVHTKLLEHIASKEKPVILSTGMATADDVDRAVETILSKGNDQIVLLHCVSLYPAPEDQVNLRKIVTLQSMFDCPIGFSDHSLGITAVLGAVSLGANMVEKHFTLDRNLPGPDHWFSSDPVEMASLVSEIRRLEKNFGSGRFRPSPEEREMAGLARRSIVAAKDLTVGHVIEENDLAFRRPGTGLPPYEWRQVLGHRLRKSLQVGDFITYRALEPPDEQ